MPPRYFNRIKNSLWCCFFSFFYLFMTPITLVVLHNAQFHLRCDFRTERGCEKSTSKRSTVGRMTKNERRSRRSKRRKIHKNGKTRNVEKRKKSTSQTDISLSINWKFVCHSQQTTTEDLIPQHLFRHANGKQKLLWEKTNLAIQFVDWFNRNWKLNPNEIVPASIGYSINRLFITGGFPIPKSDNIWNIHEVVACNCPANVPIEVDARRVHV